MGVRRGTQGLRPRVDVGGRGGTAGSRDRRLGLGVRGGRRAGAHGDPVRGRGLRESGAAFALGPPRAGGWAGARAGRGRPARARARQRQGPAAGETVFYLFLKPHVDDCGARNEVGFQEEEQPCGRQRPKHGDQGAAPGDAKPRPRNFQGFFKSLLLSKMSNFS